MRGNNSSFNLDNGIYLGYTNNAILLNNTCISNLGCGIHLDDGCINITIMQNIFSNNTMDGAISKAVPSLILPRILVLSTAILVYIRIIHLIAIFVGILVILIKDQTQIMQEFSSNHPHFHILRIIYVMEMHTMESNCIILRTIIQK